MDRATPEVPGGTVEKAPGSTKENAGTNPQSRFPTRVNTQLRVSIRRAGGEYQPPQSETVLPIFKRVGIPVVGTISLEQVGTPSVSLPTRLSSMEQRERIVSWVNSTEGYHGRSQEAPATKVDIEKKRSRSPEGKTPPVKNYPQQDTSGGGASSSKSPRTPAKVAPVIPNLVTVPETVSSNSDLYQPLPEEIAPPQKGFTGVLQEYEIWRYCPYYKGHVYFRPDVHLPKCRDRYKADCHMKGKLLDIAICRYEFEHHVHINKLAEHERNCDKNEERPGAACHTFIRERMKELRLKSEKSSADHQHSLDFK